MLWEAKAWIPINDIIILLTHRNDKKESKVDDLSVEDAVADRLVRILFLDAKMRRRTSFRKCAAVKEKVRRAD